MEEEDAIEELKHIAEKYGMDRERWHIEADKLIQEALDSAGYSKLASLYGKMLDEFWYA